MFPTNIACASSHRVPSPTNGEPDTEVTFCIYPGGNSTTDFNIERNKVYSIESNVKNLNMTDLRVTVHDFKDLSADASSNCYMIHETGKYKFRIDVKGNGVNTVGSKTPIDASVTSTALATGRGIPFPTNVVAAL